MDANNKSWTIKSIVHCSHFFFLSKIAEFVKEADGMPIQHSLFLMCRTKPENMSVDIPDLSIELTTLLIFSDITPLFLFGLKD